MGLRRVSREHLHGPNCSDSVQAPVHRPKHFIQQNKPAQGLKGERDQCPLVSFILMATSDICIRITPITAV